MPRASTASPTRPSPPLSHFAVTSFSLRPRPLPFLHFPLGGRRGLGVLKNGWLPPTLRPRLSTPCYNVFRVAIASEAFWETVSFPPSPSSCASTNQPPVREGHAQWVPPVSSTRTPPPPKQRPQQQQQLMMKREAVAEGAPFISIFKGTGH